MPGAGSRWYAQVNWYAPAMARRSPMPAKESPDLPTPASRSLRRRTMPYPDDSPSAPFKGAAPLIRLVPSRHQEYVPRTLKPLYASPRTFCPSPSAVQGGSPLESPLKAPWKAPLKARLKALESAAEGGRERGGQRTRTATPTGTYVYSHARSPSASRMHPCVASVPMVR